MAGTIRLGDDDISIAKKAAELNNRSTAGQIAHWMNIGRIIEQSPSYDHDRVSEALEAEFSYDELTASEQDVFLDEFYQSMREPSEADEAAFLAETQKTEGPVTYGGFSIEASNRLAEIIHNGFMHDAPVGIKLIEDIKKAKKLDEQGVSGFTLLMFAVLSGNDEYVKNLVRAGADPLIADDSGNSPLHVAARIDNAEMLHVLLTSKLIASHIFNTNTGVSALMEAVIANKIENVGAFLGNDAAPNHQDRAGNTALHLANTPRHFPIVRMLLAYGADPRVKNYGGVSFYDLHNSLDVEFLTKDIKKEHMQIGFEIEKAITKLMTDELGEAAGGGYSDFEHRIAAAPLKDIF